MKQHIFYTFLGIFIATALVALLGIIKIIAIDDKYLMPLFTALLIELVGAVIAIYRKVNFFDETEVSSSLATNYSKSYIVPKTSCKASKDKIHEQPIDLEEYFTRLENLSERYRERSNLKKETHGKLVLFTGVVNGVSDSKIGCRVITKSKTGKMVFVYLPNSKEADVYSLQNGDVIKVCGIVDTELESSTSIETENIERIQVNVNKVTTSNANASVD